MSAKAKTDWDAVEPIYAAGVVPTEEICVRFNCKKSRLSQVMKDRGVVRDLSEKIRVSTEDKLSRAVVASDTKKANLKFTEKIAVEAVATTNSELILKHRTDIGKYQVICDGLLQELAAQAMSPSDLAALASLKALIDSQGEVDPADVSRQITAFQKLLKLGDRADTFKQLVEAKTKLVTLERQAFGIKDDSDTKDKAAVVFYLNMFGNGTNAVQVNAKPNENEIDR